MWDLPIFTPLPDTPAAAFVRGAQAGANTRHFRALSREQTPDEPIYGFVETHHQPSQVRFEWTPKTKTSEGGARGTGRIPTGRVEPWRIPSIFIPGVWYEDLIPAKTFRRKRQLVQPPGAVKPAASRPVGHRNTEHDAPDPSTVPQPQPAKPGTKPARPVSRPAERVVDPETRPTTQPQTRPAPRPGTRPAPQPRTSPANPYSVPGWQPWEMPLPTTFPNPDVWRGPRAVPKSPASPLGVPTNFKPTPRAPFMVPGFDERTPRLTPFNSPGVDFSVQPDRKQDRCNCPKTETQKRRSDRGCTNKLLSRRVSNGIITTRRRQTCPPSKLK